MRPRAEKQKTAPPALDRQQIQARLHEILNRWPAVGFAFGLIRDGRIDFFSSHGVADIASGTPITEDTVFRIASITKTFTAVAAMQMVEQGLVDLDAPANDYLRSFKLVPAKAAFRPATLRDLLTHTSGIPEQVHPAHALRYVFSESVGLGERLPTLGDYYRGALRLVAEPGTRFMYTDHNFATVGQIVEDVSGTPITAYLREHVFEPLGMTNTDLVRSDHIESLLATGYTIGPGGPRAVIDRQWITAAASSTYSTPRDVARYLSALLGGGANEHGSVLRPETMATMFAPQYQPHPLVPGIGLAFDRYDFGGHAGIGHGGILPGFNSQIFAIPEDGIGVMAFTNGARRAMLWLPGQMAGLTSQLIGAPEKTIRTDVPQHPEVWGEICGWYQISAGATDMRAHAMFGLGAEVFVRRGELRLRVLSPVPSLYRGFALHPDDERDPYVFRIDASEHGMGTGRIIFSPSTTTRSMRLHLDFFPASLDKQPAFKNPRAWLFGGAAVLAVGAATAVTGRRVTRSKRRRA